MSSGAGEKPNNYLIPAILSTLCCCLPFGIVSIVYAAQVDSKWASGDFAGANTSAGNAKMWFWLAFGIGLAVNLAVLVIQVIAAIASLPPQN